MPVIPKAWLYGGAAVLAVVLMLAVAVSYKIAYDKGEASGTNACQAAHAAKAADDLAKSQKGIIHAAKKLQSVEDKINAAPPGDDGLLAPVLRDQLIRMRGRSAEDAPGGNASPGS